MKALKDPGDVIFANTKSCIIVKLLFHSISGISALPVLSKSRIIPFLGPGIFIKLANVLVQAAFYIQSRVPTGVAKAVAFDNTEVILASSTSAIGDCKNNISK